MHKVQKCTCSVNSIAEAKFAFGAVDVERTRGTECEEEGLFLSSHYWCFL